MKKLFLAVLCILSFYGIPATAREAPLKVVASFSILGDMVKRIGGDDVEVMVLAGPGTDLHAFQPSPGSVKDMKDAEIIVINGLGLDMWLSRLIEASGTRAKLLVASAGVTPLPSPKGESDATAVDPHAWQDLSNGKLYVRNITGALMGALPDKAEDIRKRAVLYTRELNDMDKWVREQFAALPPEKRKVITSHDAFGYFGVAYGVTFLSPLGASTETAATPADVVRIIQKIKTEGVKEVFLENRTDPRLMEQIAHDSGARISGKLYSDTLSPSGGPASTYIDMFRYNVLEIREAMKRN